MYTLWDVRAKGGNGQEIYGDDYVDIYGINRLHFMASSALECDHVSRGVPSKVYREI